MAGQENMQKTKIFAVVLGSIFLVGCSLSGSGVSVGSSGSIWKSTDGGKNWEVKNKVDEKIRVPILDILNFAFSGQDGRNFFVGTKDGVLLQTLDGGETWRKMNFQSPKIYGLDLDPNDAKIIYASGVWNKRGKIFKSFDGGEIWKEIFTFPGDGPLVVSLIVDIKNANIIYISTSDNQILKSYDAGESWQNILNSQNPVVKILIDKKNSDLVYSIDLDGNILRSRDAGKTFEDISKNIENEEGISVIEVDPANENWIYAGGKTGLLLSKDAGDSWQEFSSTFNKSENYPIKAIAINPNNSNEIIYGATQAIYRSNDGGSNWTTSQFTGEQSIRIIKYNPLNSSEVFVGFSK